jgi:endonuclease/exonuclease/phosphatase family metal-dependent hydrolase
LAAAGTAAGLIVLAELMGRVRPLDFGLGVVAGLGLDTALRLQGDTWDLPWRGGLTAWALTGLLVAASVVCLVWMTGRRTGSHWERTSIRAGILFGPLLYMACFYTVSPGYVASSAGVSLPVGAAVSLGDVVLAAGALVIGAGMIGPVWTPRLRQLTASYAIVAAAVLAVLGALLPVLTGSIVIPVVVAVQILAALCYGLVLTGDRHAPSGIAGCLALAGGALIFATLALLYQVSFLMELPFSARLLPAMAGALFALAWRAGSSVPQRCPEFAWVAGSLLVLTGLVPTTLAASASTVASVPPASPSVTVMTFNIDQAVRSGQLDLHEIGTAITASRPDVVVLQEVGRGMAVSGMTDEAEWLRQSLDLPSVWAAAGDNQFGNLVLTRLPVIDKEVVDLGRGAGTQDRSAAFVQLDLGGGHDLLVIGTHLQNGSAPALHVTRQQEYRAILDRWGGRPRTVLLGDLNTYPGWPELATLTTAGFHTTQDLSQCTMPTSNQNCPDWIFASADLSLSAVRVTVDRPDHRPVIGAVTLPTEGTKR